MKNESQQNANQENSGENVSSQESESQEITRSPYHIGMRNFKTAMSVTLCALIYFLFDRNPTFACIGAVFGMGNDMSQSKLNGGNRLFGTIIGGLLGMVLFSVYIIFYPEGGRHPFMLVLLFVGIILLILASTFVKWPGAIQPGGVMFCIILLNTPVEAYVAYSLNRIIDTGIGVLFSLMINYFLPRERILGWKERFRIEKRY